MRKIKRPSCPNPAALKKSYKNRDNRKALINAFSGKCMYCESNFAHISYGDVEHIKPKSKYPELKFQWDNLGISCTICNNNKSDKFSDNTPYINPYDEDPEDHVTAFGAVIYHKCGSERGELTIKDIELNRAGLVENRYARLAVCHGVSDQPPHVH
jgi:uncharacterized protein (TIGR02646 family)